MLGDSKMLGTDGKSERGSRYVVEPPPLTQLILWRLSAGKGVDGMNLRLEGSRQGARAAVVRRLEF